MKHAKSPLSVAVALFVAAGPVPVSHAAEYFFNTTGQDSFTTNSITTPWASLSKLNSLSLLPGDKVYLRAGQSFAGNIYLDSTKANGSSQTTGNLINPITLSTYATPASPGGSFLTTQRATINAGNSFGIYGYNNAGFDISNFTLNGSGAATNAASGIGFYTDLAGGVKMQRLNIDNVKVGGFKEGIAIGGFNGNTGYRDVRITNATAHDNRSVGIITYAQNRNVNQNVYVGNSVAYNNFGDPASTGNTGSGIVLGSVNGATIERSVAYSNGKNNTPTEGPVGIWTYDSNNVTIQYNESYANRTSGGDGGGFDLDQNVTNSVMQYNYSHDNDGAGFLLYDGDGVTTNNGNSGRNENNVVRFNISQNDGRKGNYPASGVFVGGNVRNLQVYHNTIFTSDVSNRTVPAIKVEGGSNLAFYNNILQTTGGERLLSVASGLTGVSFIGNDYWSTGGTFSVSWNGTNYTSLNAWLTAVTGQERVNNVIVGMNVDPKLVGAGLGPTLNDANLLSTLVAYQLQPASPLVSGGVNLTLSPFLLNIGGQDFYALPITTANAQFVGVTSAVPEPGITTLALGAAMLGLLRRRRPI